MKTIIFILLKIVEIAGAAAVYCGVAWFGNWLNLIFDNTVFGTFHIISFACGTLVLAFIALAFALIGGIVYALYIETPNWIKVNQRWSASILEWIKNR